MEELLNQQEEEQQTPLAATPAQTPEQPKKEEKDQSQEPSVKRAPRFKVSALLNSPWLLITIPLLGGAVWVANNIWIITNNIDKPYALLAAPVAIGSILTGVLIFKFFATIVWACKTAYTAFMQSRKDGGAGQFFWTVIIVFLIVSVFQSGDFFSMLEKDAVPGLGYVTALFVDLIAVQAMKARLNAVRMRDKKGQALYLAGVLLCAGASAFANVYTSLASFHAVSSGVLPDWMIHVAPYFGLVFPALILLLSVTADYTIDQTSTKLDPDSYKALEEKRVKMLEVQRDMLKRRIDIEAQIDGYSVKLNEEKRTFFLWEIVFPKKRAARQKETAQIVALVKQEISPWFAHVDAKLVQALKVSSQEQAQLFSQVRREIGQVSFEMNAMIDLVVSRETVSPPAKPEVSQYHEPVSLPANLSDETIGVRNEPERKTDSLVVPTSFRHPAKPARNQPMPKQVKLSTPSGRGEAMQRALHIVKENSGIAPGDLATQAGITPQYARKLLRNRTAVNQS